MTYSSSWGSACSRNQQFTALHIMRTPHFCCSHSVVILSISEQVPASRDHLLLCAILTDSVGRQLIVRLVALDGGILGIQTSSCSVDSEPTLEE